MFTEQAGVDLTKSNFWFSLLYLKEIKEQEVLPKHVVLISLTNDNNVFFERYKKRCHGVLCDDGMYQGGHMKKTIYFIKQNPRYD
jgi:hypothetical protein